MFSVIQGKLGTKAAREWLLGVALLELVNQNESSNGLRINGETQEVDLDRPVTLVQCTDNPEHLIVKIARVSSKKPGHDEDFSTGPKLLNYLIRHSHWSPFEHSFMTVRIQTELDVAAQLCRHRSFTWQQLSGRYTTIDRAKVPNFRRQDVKNRQTRSTISMPRRWRQHRRQLRRFSSSLTTLTNACLRWVLPVRRRVGFSRLLHRLFSI